MLNITYEGNPLIVLGEQLKVGDRMLNFSAVTKKSEDWSLSNIKGIKVISVVPSLDTPVCQLQTRRFNREIVEFDGVSVITISLDLPYAQLRWCAAEGINNLIVISDYKDREFAKKTGLLIDELKLLTRAVFVIDNENTVKYVEYVKEITNEPNYDAVKDFIKSL